MQSASAAEPAFIQESPGYFATQRSHRIALRGIKSLLLVMSSVAFAILLLFIWVSFTVLRYGYWGYVWQPTWIALIFALMAIGLIGGLMPVALERPGDITLYILYTFAYIPGMIIPPSLLAQPANELLTLQLMLSVSFVALLVFNWLPCLRISYSPFRHSGFSWFLLILIVILFLPVVVFVGLPSSVPGFAEVYESRAAASVRLSAAPIFVAYFWGFLTSAVFPFAVAYGVVYRNVLVSAAGILGTMYVYATAGNKSVLFSIGLVLIVWAGIQILGSSIALFIVPGFSIMAFMARAIDLVIEIPWATAILIDRAFVTPGALTGYYFEFFSQNEKAHWAHSFLSGFSEYKYDLEPARLIGHAYYSPETRANTHMWADGFANFGYVGMLVVTLVAGLIIWLFNSASSRKNVLLSVPLMAAASYSLAGASLFTALLSHGLALSLLLLFFLPSEESGSEDLDGVEGSNGA